MSCPRCAEVAPGDKFCENSEYFINPKINHPVYSHEKEILALKITQILVSAVSL